MIKYPAKIVYSKSDNCYNVEFPDLDGCFTFGFSMEEALHNAQEALNGFLESIDLRKLQIPKPSKLNSENIFYIQPEHSIAFAIWLKTKRLEKNLSQKKLAELLNVRFQTIQQYENPTKTNPTLKTIAKLEKVFKENIINL